MVDHIYLFGGHLTNRLTTKHKLSFLAALLAAVFLIAGFSSKALAASTNRFVSPSGTDNATCDAAHPCQHVQWAIDHANAGDTVRLAPGTYTEQLIINKDLGLVGAGMDNSIIKAPVVLTADADGKKNVVELSNAATLTASRLTVSGPGPSSCGSIDSGLAVIGGATLDLSHAAVRDIRDNPFSGCQNGEAIRAGTQRYSEDAQVGHLDVDHVTVSNYNKNGIVLAGEGSSGSIDHSSVSTTNHQIASNGIEVIDGATVDAEHNTVSGNECNVAEPVCGPEFVNTNVAQSTGFLINGAGGGINLSHNTVTGNDMGIYTDTGLTMSHNFVDNNRYEGLVADKTANGLASSHDYYRNDGNYGAWVGSTYGGSFVGNASFRHDTGSGNSTYDLFWDGGGTLTADKNHCGTASPSKTAWDCV